jgi:hypothetical protein
VNLSVTDGIISDHINFTINVVGAGEPPRIIDIGNTAVDQWESIRIDFDVIDGPERTRVEIGKRNVIPLN